MVERKTLDNVEERRGTNFRDTEFDIQLVGRTILKNGQSGKRTRGSGISGTSIRGNNNAEKGMRYSTMWR